MKEDINLLPPEAKFLRIKSLYLNRLGHLMIIGIGLSLLSVGSLVGVWVVNMMVLRDIGAGIELSGKAGAEVETEVRETNEFVKAFRSEVEVRQPLLPKVGELIDVVPVGVRLTTLVWEGEEKGLSVEGVADSTEVIVDLKNDFEDLVWVKRVRAPLQNFATEEEGEFSLTLELVEE